MSARKSIRLSIHPSLLPVVDAEEEAKPINPEPSSRQSIRFPSLNATSQPRRRSSLIVRQARAHPFTLVAAATSCVLFIICLVLLWRASSCTSGGCRLKWKMTEDTAGGPLRLILSFSDGDIDAMDLLPTFLRSLTSRRHIKSSALHVVTFADEATYQQALKYIEVHPALGLMMRDQILQRGVPPDSGISAVTADQLLSEEERQDAAWKLGEHEGLDGTMTGAMPQAPSAPPAPGTKRGMLRTAGPGNWASSSANTKSVFELPVNDPLFRQQWHLRTIRAAATWTVTAGAPDVVIAVIDSGIELQHPDLVGQLWTNPKEVPNNGIDDDGNGFIDDVHGYDFGGSSCQPGSKPGVCNCVPSGDVQATAGTPEGSHGTAIAGLIAAFRDNAQGGTGLAPMVKLMIIKVTDCNTGSANAIYTSAVLQAYDYALLMGAHVISCSFGPSNPFGFNPIAITAANLKVQSSIMQAHTQALQPLANKGVLVIAAAGNEGTDLDNLADLGYAYAPCLVALPNVVCVSATDVNDATPYWSNRGNNTVHLAAPGLNIITTLLSEDGLYGVLNGTSFAAPLVAGAAGLALGLLGLVDRQHYRAVEVKKLLLDSSTYIASLPVASQGRLDAFSAVEMAANSGIGPSTGAIFPDAAFDPALNAFTAGGYNIEYYAADSAAVQSANQLKQYTGSFSSGGLPLLDTSVMPGLTPSTSSGYALGPFKYVNDVLIVIASHMYLPLAGAWGVAILTGSPRAAWSLEIGGEAVPMVTSLTPDILPTSTRPDSSMSGQGGFMAHHSGFFTCKIVLVNPGNHSFSLLLQAPGTGDWVAFNALFVGTLKSATTAALPPPAMPTQPLAYGWQLFYNKVPVTTTTAMPLSPAVIAQYSAPYTFYGVAPSLNAVNALTMLFASGGAGRNGAVGFATTTLLADAQLSGARFGTQNVSLTISCAFCRLRMNGLLIADSWSTAPGQPPVTTGTSGCLALQPGVSYNLTLEFAMDMHYLYNSRLAVTLRRNCTQLAVAAGCRSGSSSGGSTTGTALAEEPCRAVAAVGLLAAAPVAVPLGGAAIAAAGAWQDSVTAASVGKVNGMQCDAWRAASVPRSGGAEPDYKVRLPRCAGQAPQDTSCTTSLNFTLDSLFPGLAAKFLASLGEPFSLQCYTYLDLARFDISQALQVLPRNAASGAWLAGQPVWAGGIIGSRVPLTWPSMQYTGGNNTIRPGGAYSRQLFVVQWQSIGPETPLAVNVGGVPVTVDLVRMQLPLLMTALPSDPNTPPPPDIGMPVHQSQAYLVSPADDALPVMQHSVAGLRACSSYLGPVSVRQQLLANGMCTGLLCAAGYNWRDINLSNQTHYSRIDGWLLSDGSWPRPTGTSAPTCRMQILVIDNAGQSSAIHFANVTIKNAQPFNASSTATTSVSVSACLPRGYVAVTMTIKTASPDGISHYNVSLQDVSSTILPDRLGITAWRGQGGVQLQYNPPAVPGTLPLPPAITFPSNSINTPMEPSYPSSFG